MNKRVRVIILSVIIVLLTFAVGISFAYFSLIPTITNTTPVNVTFQNGVVANFVANSTVDLNVTVSGSNMLGDSTNTVAGTDNKLLNVTLQSDTKVKCTYDVYFSWNSNTPNNYTKTTYEGDEFTVSGTTGTLSFGEVQVPNSGSEVKLGTFTINANSSIVTQSWNITANFYNINANQDAHENKTYSGKIDVRNAVCSGDEFIKNGQMIANYNDIDANGQEWGITNENGIRFVGQNPNNYVWFNGERWRIIGTFITEYKNSLNHEDTAELTKIIRADTFGEMKYDYKSASNTYNNPQNMVGSAGGAGGSPDWSDAQIMMMLNPSDYLNTGYKADGTLSHSGYTINNNGYVLDSYGHQIYRNMGAYFDNSTNPMNAYVPAQATTSGFNSNSTISLNRLSSVAQNMIAETKWYLYGTNQTNGVNNGSPREFYKVERNIDNKGELLASGLQTTYWWGKVGLIYASDFGYSTGGQSINGSGEQDREACLDKEMFNWDNTYCGLNNWISYTGATSNSNIGVQTDMWSITPNITNSYQVYIFGFDGSLGYCYVYQSSTDYISLKVRPTLYLKPNVSIDTNNADGSYEHPFNLIVN